MKDRVLQWIEQGCDYPTGILLLADSGRHRQLIKVISGRPHRYASKLLYELCKEADIPFIDLGRADLSIIAKDSHGQADSFQNKDIPGQADSVQHKDLLGQAGLNQKQNSGQADDKKSTNCLSTNSPDDAPVTDFMNLPDHLKTKSDSDFNQLPPDMQKVIWEHSKLYMLRSQLHEQMANMPEDNQADTVKKRKNLSDSIAQLSPRIDLLFQAKEDFYLKSLKPNMEVLFPTAPIADSTPKETPLPDSALELKKLKKNLQSANTKDQNMLQYQDEKKADKPTPMPSGPKRLKLEQRITQRLIQIEAIDYKLLTVKE